VPGPVFMFCAPGVVSRGTEGVGSHFQVLLSLTRFRRYRGHRVSFSCFARPYSFPAVPRASVPVFMFCASGLVFDHTEVVGSHFHILRSRTHFRRYRGRRIRFSCFALPDSFSTVPSASGPFFMFSCARTHFRRYHGRPISFSCFPLPDMFLAVRRASGPVFMFSAVPRALGPFCMFCTPGLIFSETEGVGSRFHFCVPGLVFVGTEGAVSRFHVLRAWTRYRRYQGHRVPFSYFALPDIFSTVPRVSGPVFMFCTPGHVFGRTEDVLGLIFMFCALRLIFGGTEGVGSRFHVLSSQTHFRRYRVR
jgi:hypothetical protein